MYNLYICIVHGCLFCTCTVHSCQYDRAHFIRGRGSTDVTRTDRVVIIDLYHTSELIQFGNFEAFGQKSIESSKTSSTMRLGGSTDAAEGSEDLESSRKSIDMGFDLRERPIES